MNYETVAEELEKVEIPETWVEVVDWTMDNIDKFVKNGAKFSYKDTWYTSQEVQECGCAMTAILVNADVNLKFGAYSDEFMCSKVGKFLWVISNVVGGNYFEAYKRLGIEFNDEEREKIVKDLYCYDFETGEAENMQEFFEWLYDEPDDDIDFSREKFMDFVELGGLVKVNL